jgi:triacylglycerol esterase/lipase EstA (alpha/beta hydrolase family)
LLGTLEELAATLTFVGSRVGSYNIENGNINFQSSADVDTYAAHVAKLQAIAARQEQFDKEVKVQQEADAKKLRDSGLQ